eukprot:CAMPEP_0119535054 /NCGR_PEP_ID=MMETSP1344-20130328/48163_1 /TAXON_ID=236787 /ORGANISM="Florenciella parvula, Strain CCMP2471" /LENGTH=669 /DNA_ID=CAMNT_0007576521 /DNA_START=78 /DNA_END=2087 /DNA_ORIENTATION=-
MATATPAAVQMADPQSASKMEGGMANAAVVSMDPDACPREVKTKDRPFTDPCCAYTFGISVLVFIVLTIVLAANAHPVYTVKNGEVTGVGEHYLNDMKSCCNYYYTNADNTTMGSSYNCELMIENDQWSDPTVDRRLLQADEPAPRRELTESVRRRLSSKKNLPENIWEGFGNRPLIPVTMVVGAVLVCIAFIKSMEKCSKVILFGTFFIQTVGAVYLGIVLKGEVFYVAAVCIAVWVVVFREKIGLAAEVIAAAAHALLSLPSLMFTIYAWLLVSAALIAIYILANSTIGLVQEVESADVLGRGCVYNSPLWVSPVTLVTTVIWNWVWQYTNATQIFFVTGCVGTFHFDRAKAVASLPLELIKIAFTTSAGTLSKLALVFQAVEALKKNSKPNCQNCCLPPMCGCMNPVFYVALIARYCFINFLNMLTKFTLIFHAFTGEAFWPSAIRTTNLLKKAGMQGMVLEQTAITCFHFLGYGISVAFGFATWAWMGTEYDQDVLGGNTDGDQQWANLLKWFMMIAFWILMLNPFMSVILVVVIAMVAQNAVIPVWIPWCCGLFTGGIVNFFFMQSTQALLYASNTVFIAIAVDKANGVTPQGMEDSPLYAATQKAIAEAVIVDEKGNVLSGGKSNVQAGAPAGVTIVQANPPAPVAVQGAVVQGTVVQGNPVV